MLMEFRTMESIAFLKDMGQFLGISNSSKGECVVTIRYLLFISFYASFIIYPSLLDPFGYLHPTSCSTHGVFPF
jgi:hypothetical protein